MSSTQESMNVFVLAKQLICKQYNAIAVFPLRSCEIRLMAYKRKEPLKCTTVFFIALFCIRLRNLLKKIV